MNPAQRNPLQNRRGFLETAGAVIQAAGIGSALASLPVRAASAPDKSGEANPFAYDVDRLRHTDPKLLHYQETKRFRTPRAEPRRICVAPDDRLFLAAGKYVVELGPDGSAVREWPLPTDIRCLAASGEGEIYVGLRDHIEVFDAQGRRTQTWEVPGPKAYFTALAVSKDSVFAADAGQRLVLRYDRSGRLVKRLGAKDPAREIPGFIVPSPFFDVEIARDGLLRVTNPGRHRVEAYTIDGDLEFHWGRASMGIDGFCGCCNPINLALMNDGRCVTFEKGLPRVKVHSADGKMESVVAGCESFAENANVCGPSDCSVGGLDGVVNAKGQIVILDLVAADIRILERKQA
jgi:hypothetical protein